MDDLSTADTPTRSPLAVGREYRYLGYPTGFRVTAMSLPGHPSDDGGIPGVAIRWLMNGRVNRNRDGGWCPFDSESAFWDHMLFRNAYDVPTEAP